MGFFGSYLFTDGRWVEHDPSVPPAVMEPWLLVSVHDSDFTWIAYSPVGSGTGSAFLGFTPRVYFEDDQAPPTDTVREADGLASWWAGARAASEAERAAKAAELLAFLADDEPADDLDDTDGEDELDDGDVFVEVKTARFLTALNLPVPDDLPS